METSRDGCKEGWGKQEVSTHPPTPCYKYPQLLSFELPPHSSPKSSLCSSLRSSLLYMYMYELLSITHVLRGIVKQLHTHPTTQLLALVVHVHFYKLL